MAKKALLVTYQPTTRIVVDIPDGMTLEEYAETSKGIDTIHTIASEKMKSSIDDYMSIENIDIMEDTEFPYGTFNYEQ